MALAKKKKKFFDVDIPLLKKETQLYAFSIEELEGRIIKYDLTRFLRGKNAILTLNVKIDKDKATSTPKEFIILPTFIKKMVRKGTSYVEDSFIVSCKDFKIQIKPFLIARRKVSRKVRKALRDKAKEELIEYVKSRTAETLFKELLKNQLQKPLSLILKKTYPLSLCEIRFLKVLEPLEKKKETKKSQDSKKETIEEPKEESGLTKEENKKE